MGDTVVFEGSRKLTDIFGYWPSFHDAEVHKLLLERGNVDASGASHEIPTLTIRIHLFEMTDKVDSAGFFVLIKHTLATLRFHDVDESSFNGFNHQNAILGLTVTAENAAPRKTPVLKVNIESAFGLGATFKCSRCEVVEAMPCDKLGRLYA
jgi:hypothetical protein